MFNKQILRVMINERLSETAEEILSLFEQAVAEYQREIERLSNASAATATGSAPRQGAAPHTATESDELLLHDLQCDNAPAFQCKEEIEQVMITHEEYKPQMFPKSNKEDNGQVKDTTEGSHGAEPENSFKVPLQSLQSEEEESGADNNNAHLPKKAFSCPLCQKLFPDRRQMRIHMRLVHSDEEEPLTSAEMDCEGSASQQDLDSLEARPWSCTFCFRRFKQMEGLGMHMREHDGERLFRCTECGAAFAKQANFSCHMRTMHSTDKPFKCSVCDKSLKTAHALRTHMLIHTGERPFKCLVCGRGFVQKVSLKNHMVTHTGEKPFACTECGKNYSNKQSLMIHMRLIHH